MPEDMDVDADADQNHEEDGDEHIQVPLIEDDSNLERPAECIEFGPSPPFALMTSLFETLEEHRTRATVKGKTKGSQEYKIKLLGRFFENYRKNVGLDLHPIVRLMIPERDRLRNTYGVKEKLLAEAYIGAFGLSKNTSAAARLVNWKAPKMVQGFSKSSGSAGDFSLTCYDEIKMRSTMVAERGNLSIAQANETLDHLCNAKDKQERIQIIRFIYENMTPTEQKWLIRIILKDLKNSAKERTVLSVLHPDATDLFNVCSDLRRVCWTLWDTSYRLPHEDSTVKIFLPFRPMLCKRNTETFFDIVKMMGRLGNDVKTEGFIMEEKLDGERIQLHKKGDEFRFYSRKDKDYTYLYGKSREEGSLTPFIHDLIHANIEEIILDGEMLAWDPMTKRTRPFGGLKTAALDKSDDPLKARPVFKIFDVLYAKARNQKTGQNLLGKKLSARHEFIRRFVKEREGRLEWAERRTGKNAQDIKIYMEEVCERFGEGLVIKNPKSTYTLNGREDAWVKAKPDYMTDHGEMFDLLVIGGFYGSGKRGGYYGSFFCGILDDSQEDNPRYLSFVKVGSGLSLNYLESIKRATEGKWRPFPKDKSNPPGLAFGAEKPDEWIAPHDSVMLKIKAAEIVPDAKNYAAGLCLRFPRVQYYEYEQDHNPQEHCLKFSDFLTKRSADINRKRTIDDDWSGPKSKKRRVIKKNAPSQVAEVFKGAKVDGIAVSSNIFEGVKFWVLEGDTSLGVSKNDLEKLVFRNGGDYCQSIPTQEDRMIISSRIDFITARNVINKGEDVILPSYILNCLESKQRLDLTADDYAHASEDTLKDLKKGQGRRISQGNGSQRNNQHRATTTADESETEDDESDSRSKKNAPLFHQDSETEDSDADRHDRLLDTDGSEAEDRPNLGSLSLARYAQSRAPGMARDSTDRDFSKDPALLFKHLYFYLDTLENAEATSLEYKDTAVSVKDPKWVSVMDEIESAGGHIVTSLEEPHLTHVIIHGSDNSRAAELFRRTPKEPRYRHFVINFWVGDSIENMYLQEEGNYRP